MYGNTGKGSRSKPKSVKPEPAERELEHEPLKMSLGDSAVVASDRKDGKDFILIGMEIPIAEEQDQMIEVTSGFVVIDGYEEKDQNSPEDNDHEKDVVTEIKVDRTEVVCTQEGTIGNLKEVSHGAHAATSLSLEDDEERTYTENPEEDEAPLKFDNNDSTGDEREVITKDVSANNKGLASDHALTENMTDNLENYKELSELDAEGPVGGATSDREVEENANIMNEVKAVNGNVNKPKKKVVKKKVVRKKLVRKIAVNKEVPQPFEENNVSGEACEVDADKRINIEEKASDLNNASVGECKADNDEHVSNEEEAEVKPSLMFNKKRKRIRKKKVSEGQSSIPTGQDAQKPQFENAKLNSEEHDEISRPDLKNEEVKNSGNKVSPSKRSKKKKIAKKGSREMVSKDVKKPKKGKSSKKVESMGMIFMCSSETKKDCYRYKVLGLPASKKDMVLKIYKGMRLFLFDVDLRMMYGIYKAADPGGYNIEPRAFKSQFPSQVRFSVLEDCVPLAEESFRKVLKDNYYSKKKFNFQLNNEQVKNLCKLFHETSKKAKPTKAAIKTQRAAAASSAPRRDSKKRKRVEDSRKVVTARPPPLERERTHRRPHEEIRLVPMVISDRYHERSAYPRETYVPSVTPVYQPQPAPRSPPRRTYSYDRISGVDPYRRETVIDSRDLAPFSQESRLPIERRSHYDSYASYREAPRGHSGQAYSSGTMREHYDYATSDGRNSEYYRTGDYRPPPLLYRRY